MPWGRRLLQAVPMLIQVKGTPRPQPRPRIYKGRAVSCADKNAKAWIAAIENECRQVNQDGRDLAGPLAISLAYRFPTFTQDRVGQAHLATPDADNLAKLTLDCFQRTGLIRNDAAVWKLEIQKTWSSPGEAGLDARISLEGPGARQELDRPGWLG